jgi:hypothetical protein
MICGRDVRLSVEGLRKNVVYKETCGEDGMFMI